jgi:hypothetical protein
MNTNALFVYSRDARLAGSRPRNERTDLKGSVESFRGKLKNERRVLRRVSKPEVVLRRGLRKLARLVPGSRLAERDWTIRDVYLQRSAVTALPRH